MATTTPEQIRAVRHIALAIVDAVREAGEHGAPEGVLYAGLMAHMSLNTFNQFIGVLERTGKLRREGYLLFATDKETSHE